jgi:hypothetical protein
MGLFAQTTVEGTQLAPYQYRVLFAYIFQPAAELLSLHVAAWLFWFISLAVMALLIDEIITAVNGDKLPLFAALAIIPGLIWFHSGGAVWSVLEGIFIAGALLAMIRGKTTVLYPLVFVATLNRETAVLIPLMVLFWGWRHAVGLLSVWLAVYVGIHWAIGPAPLHLTLADIWQINTGPGFLYFLMGLPAFGWLFWYAGKGWRRASGVMRGAAVIVAAYLVLFGIFGIWYEWRWILSLYPVIVPLVGLAHLKVSAKTAPEPGGHIIPVWVLDE